MNFPTMFLGPMAEISTPPFRKVVRDFSKNTVLYSEMLSASSVARGGFKNQWLEYKNPDDDPFVYQLLGNSPEDIALASEILSEREPLGIDINMGCSAPDIAKKGYGSKLMLPENFELVRRIISSSRLKSKQFLSVKMRIGYEKYDPEYLLKFCTMLENEGVDYITIHGRTGKQAFKRASLKKPVLEVKKALNIPVIYNGDITDSYMGHNLLLEKSFDGIMISRAAVSFPWIFTGIEHFLERKSFTADKLQVAESILRGIFEFYPKELHKSRGLRFCAYYMKNFKFGHDLFRFIRQETCPLRMFEHIENYIKKHSDERYAVYI